MLIGTEKAREKKSIEILGEKKHIEMLVLGCDLVGNDLFAGDRRQTETKINDFELIFSKYLLFDYEDIDGIYWPVGVE